MKTRDGRQDMLGTYAEKVFGVGIVIREIFIRGITSCITRFLSVREAAEIPACVGPGSHSVSRIMGLVTLVSKYPCVGGDAQGCINACS